MKAVPPLRPEHIHKSRLTTRSIDCDLMAKSFMGFVSISLEIKVSATATKKKYEMFNY